MRRLSPKVPTLVEKLEPRQLLTSSPQLVIDLETTPRDISPDTAFFAEIGERIVWVQEDLSDDPQSELRTNIYQISTSANSLQATIPGQLTNYRISPTGIELEVFNDSADERWGTDGSAAGTELVQRDASERWINRPRTFSADGGPVRVGLDGDDYTLTIETPAGAALVLANLGDLGTMPALRQVSSTTQEFVLVKSSADESNALWVTNGTRSGTQTLVPTTDRPISVLRVFADRLLFRIDNEAGGREFWMSDGTVDGTNRIEVPASIPNASTSRIHEQTSEWLLGSSELPDGNFVYWSLNDTFAVTELGQFAMQPTRELVDNTNTLLPNISFSVGGRSDADRWTSDGTAAGTFEVSPDMVDSFASVDQRLELVATQDATQLRLRTDSDPVLLADELAIDAKFVDDDSGLVYFVSGQSLWQTDGTEAGTRVVTDAAVNSQELLNGVVLDGQVALFDGQDVWVSGLADLPEVAIDNFRTDGSSPLLLGQLGRQAMLTTRDDDSTLLWLTDGTEQGTSQLANVTHRFPDGRPQHLNFAPGVLNAGDWTYLMTGQYASPLVIRTMGTPETTESLAFPSSILASAVVGEQPLLLSESSQFDQIDLWTMDSANGEPRLIFEAVPFTTSREFRRLWRSPVPTEFGGKIYLQSDIDAIWQTDGTTEGTRALPMPAGQQVPRELRAAGDRLFFIADSTDGLMTEILYIDSSDQVTSTGIQIPQQTQVFTLADGEDYFLIYESTVGGNVTTSVVQTNGEQTREYDLPHRAHFVGGPTVGYFEIVNERLVYSAPNEDGRDRVFATDGTEVGTEQLFVVDYPCAEAEVAADCNPARSAAIEEEQLLQLIKNGSNLFVITNKAIWKSDATRETTIQIATLDSVTPEFYHGEHVEFLGDELLFAGRSLIFGTELFKVSTTPEPLVGDVDSDFDVDFADFLVLSTNYGKEVDAALSDGDVDGNGMVDFSDFLLLSENFGTSLKPS